MCFKAPKPDPNIARQQKEMRQAELARLAETKKKQLAETKRGIGTSGVRSLISGTDMSGYGRNFTDAA